MTDESPETPAPILRADPIYSLGIDADGVVIKAAASNMVQPDSIEVDVDTYYRAQGKIGRCKLIDGEVVDYEPPKPPRTAPDRPSLSDWRVALILLGQFQSVKAKVEAARDAGTPNGLIAWERFEYANNVERSELLDLAPVLGFDEADVDESLWKAENVSRGLRVSGPAERA